ncbi:hypothetical protein TorRG33x02_245050 [Trema orientale]|uniref:Uncharacterized protein n=1 Tax=Trema orientale TaxID=63057 RepID=A0A2P5DQV0_TREOI|nr:hypothetical protein TorRG33x02_245050 [Trema orientale]
MPSLRALSNVNTSESKNWRFIPIYLAQERATPTALASAIFGLRAPTIFFDKAAMNSPFESHMIAPKPTVRMSLLIAASTFSLKLLSEGGDQRASLLPTSKLEISLLDPVFTSFISII